MRGDQLAREGRFIRAIEASPSGLTVAEIAKREETGICTIRRNLGAFHAAGLPMYTEKVERTTRWAFIDTLKLRTPPPFIPTELNRLYYYNDFLAFHVSIKTYKSTPMFKKVVNEEGQASTASFELPGRDG